MHLIINTLDVKKPPQCLFNRADGYATCSSPNYVKEIYTGVRDALYV